jgi:tight adherence protein C
MATLLSTLLAGDLLIVPIIGVTTGCALLLGLALHHVLAARRNAVRERLRRAVAAAPPVAAPAAARSDNQSLWHAALAPFARIARPTNQAELGRLRARLAHAGLRHERALVNFLGAKVILALALGAAVLWLNAARATGIPSAPLVTILMTCVGLYLPNLWLAGRVTERQIAIDHGLPDTLDLLVTCVEAGLGLDAAINRVADEVQLSAPLLSRELAQCALEMRAGVDRGEAFRRLAERTGVEELRNLSAIVVQTQIFGTSIAKSLRIQAEAMRVRRMQRAEERAAMVGVKMTLPLVFCILPALFAVLMGPAAVNIIRILLPTLGGPS